MGTFELGRDISKKTNDMGEAGITATAAGRTNLDPRRLREECLISFKVYDACRLQECLTVKELGPAHAVDCEEDGFFTADEIIEAPPGTESVTIDKLIVKDVIIESKVPSAFRAGFWDVDLKYVFEYVLIFRNHKGAIIARVRAYSIFNRRVTLFGSIGSDISISTDLFSQLSHMDGESTMINADPFILVESKAVALDAELLYANGHFRHHRPPHHPVPPIGEIDPDCGGGASVAVTIGLFSIVKLFRIVQLLVESRGFCVPPECEEILPINACEFFDNLDFPMDIFAPPQRPEFCAGISSNIPSERRGVPSADQRPDNDRRPCGCR